MINDNFEDEITGFMFSVLYLLKDAEKNNLTHTRFSLLRTLDAFLCDCSSLSESPDEYKKMVDLCLASMNLYPDEREKLLDKLEKHPNKIHKAVS